MKIETILLACDNGPKFLSFLPSVSYHWKSMGYRVAFGLVTPTDLAPEEEARLRGYVDDFYVHRYDPETCPYTRIVMSKLFRFYLTKHYPTSTVCVQDIDYYVFDKHEHIESKIRDPANEVLTHGYNAYYKPVIPCRPARFRNQVWIQTTILPRIPGLAIGDLVFNDRGKLGTPSRPLPRTHRYEFLDSEIRFPATPLVAHGSLIYRIFSSDPQQTFDAFLAELARRQPTFSPVLTVGGQSVFTHPEFSDETLITQLNRTNGVQYYHTIRDDFEDGLANKRIDPRAGKNPDSWIPKGQGRRYKELLHAGQILDIQPNRPLEASQVMKDVFVYLQIPSSLLYPSIDAEYEAKFGTTTDVRSLGWGSENSQTTRFRVLLDLEGLENEHSILDVGCGYGDLSTYVTVYTGIDIRPRAIEEAKRRYPDIDVRVGSIETVDDTFDWAVASGIFAFACPNWNEQLVHTVREMLARATKGVAINVLSSRTPNAKDPEMMYADPDTVLDLLTPLAPRVVLRDDYLVNDMTVYLYKDSSRI